MKEKLLKMSAHSWFFMARKSCKHFYLRKIMRVFSSHILSALLESRAQLYREVVYGE